MGSTFKSVFADIKRTLLEAKDGISEVIEGIFNLDPAKIKSGYDKLSANLGKNAAAAFQLGYDFGAGNQIDLLGSNENFGLERFPIHQLKMKVLKNKSQQENPCQWQILLPPIM
ncbi:MAG: hypothetical protein KTR26_19170 [Flammeovirgaceae bacterium]|nr:hypothetical protein [Flammeovirgaceae bacterium]